MRCFEHVQTSSLHVDFIAVPLLFRWLRKSFGSDCSLTISCDIGFFLLVDRNPLEPRISSMLSQETLVMKCEMFQTVYPVEFSSHCLNSPHIRVSGDYSARPEPVAFGTLVFPVDHIFNFRFSSIWRMLVQSFLVQFSSH